MTYEIIRAAEKQRLYMRPTRYTVEMFNNDYEILGKLYWLSKTERVDKHIDIYFRVKFFRQLGKFPFINPIPYMNATDGIDCAYKDIGILSFDYFFIQ